MKSVDPKTAAVTVLLGLLLPLIGCQSRQEAPRTNEPGDPTGGAVAAPFRDEMLTYAVDSLNHLEEYSAADIFQQIQERLGPQKQPQEAEAENAIDRLAAAWPEPEMLRQAIDRLNQWIRTQPPPANWTLDPLVASLPKPLADLPQVANLDKMEFSHYDAPYCRKRSGFATWAAGCAASAWTN